MRDLYQVLGLKDDASIQTIKKAYRTLALSAHPDRGGNAQLMGLLNEAYETLSDPEKRRDFDARHRVFQETDVEQAVDSTVAGHLAAGDTLPYSQAFKEEYGALVREYLQTPLPTVVMKKNLNNFQSSIYRLDDGGAIKVFHDIFSFIQEKNKHKPKEPEIAPIKEPLTPVIAVKIFIDFLSGSYYGVSLITLKGYLSVEIKKMATSSPRPHELLLYDGILEVVLLSEAKPEDQHNLIFSIKKITDFAQKTSDYTLSYLIPLFYNKFFRNLYAHALHLYWNSSEGSFDVKHLKQFDGQAEAKELLEILRDRLSSSSGNENLGQLVQYVKLLYHFEKDSNESSGHGRAASDYRKRAFYLLDWIPAFVGKASLQILVNIILQIGINFQQASRLELQPVGKMADERLALKMYLTAVGIGYHSTPDVEIYANTHVLQYVAAFQFQNLILNDIIPALQKKTLIIADVFPFFEDHQSNIAFLRHEDKTIHLMRRLLNAMIEIFEYNKTHPESVIIDHSAVTVLYQAYEACLKNWYQEEYDPAAEQKFRLELMEELLFDNSWSFLDVEQNLDVPWVMVDRNEGGWMVPTRTLPYSEDPSIVKYRSIRGAEVNHKSGEIAFFMDPWSPDRPAYEKVFTLFDLQQMLEKNLDGAIFSLDPVDPDKPYHPFNSMRFSPSQLCESELLNTMLLTDYILKFLTTDQEVQGRYPYEQRPVETMIQHLPEYLRKIITDFHHEQHSGALHRFWIEAEEIDVALPEEVLEKDGIARIVLGDLKMIVKKHRMERDIVSNIG